nr:hypothetical protein [Tolivirales sp.]
MAKSKPQRNMKRRATRANKRDVGKGILGMPTAWPGSSAMVPGVASVRMVTEVFSSNDARFLSKDGFATWSSQVTGILSPYRFWRVARCDAEVVISGGAASTYSVAFNVSNAPSGDNGVTAILNDDYAAVSTALLRPKLQPPKMFWDGRPYDWYTFAGAGDTAYSEPNSIAGVVSLSGSGGATSGTVIGYLVLDLVLEFHTLA